MLNFESEHSWNREINALTRLPQNSQRVLSCKKYFFTLDFGNLQKDLNWKHGPQFFAILGLEMRAIKS